METKQESKIKCLIFWEYMVKHPDKSLKNEHPLFSEFLDKYLDSCPLCSIFRKTYKGKCKGCPLKTYVPGLQCMHYNRWVTANTDKERKYYAEIIVDKVKKWNTEEGWFKRFFNYFFKFQAK